VKLLSAIEQIKQRTSCAQLGEPPPSKNQLDTLYEVAFRAADHRQLKPVRFLEIQGVGLDTLGDLFARAKKAAQPDLSADDEARARSLPGRAPLIIAVIASYHEDPKVPRIEQVLSAGASVQNMLNAAYAMGLGVIWRTGDLAFNSDVTGGLGVGENEELIGFLYLGTPKVGFRTPPKYDYQKHVKQWP